MFSRIFANDSRIKKIFAELIATEKPITSLGLANIIGVTDRTIRKDIKEINSKAEVFGFHVKGIRGKGYLINVTDNELYNKFLRAMLKNNQKEDCIVPTLPDERANYIVKKLLTARDYLTLESLAEELFVSKATINGDISKVEHIVKEYGLTIFKKKHYGIKLMGDEIKIRLCLSKFLTNKTCDTATAQTTQFGEKILSDADLDKIKEVIFKNIQKSQLKLSDITFNNLAIHIAIAIYRIKNGSMIKPSSLKKELEIEFTKEYIVAKNIIDDIKNIFNINIHEQEILYITMHLLSKEVFYYSNFKFSQLEEMVGGEILNLLNEIVTDINRKYQINLSNDNEFIFNLGMHLKPALNRINYGMYLENPLLEEIKISYSFAFEMGVTAGKIISKYTNQEINEHEIGYIAMHFASALERRKYRRQGNFEKILLVCATGAGTAKLLETKIKRIIKDVKFITTLPSYELRNIDIEEFDLILTTIPLKIQSKIPIIQVNALLTESDIKKINKVMNRKILEEQNMHSRVKGISKSMFKEELFILDLEAKDEYDTINKICLKLEMNKYVDSDFKDAIIRRERISSTSCGNLVAIPHAINKKGTDINITTAILKKPIMWGKENTQLVLLLALPQQMHEGFETFFEDLVEILNNKPLILSLIKVKSFAEFIDCLQL